MIITKHQSKPKNKSQQARQKFAKIEHKNTRKYQIDFGPVLFIYTTFSFSFLVTTFLL